jgi:hypothetical protein
MSNVSTFENVTIALWRHLKAKKEAMQERHARELAEVEKEIEAVHTTLRLLKESTNPEVEQIEPTPQQIPNDLVGKSAREACIEIAKRNGGLVRVSDAKKALVAAGILKESKNTWSAVYTTLHRSKEFEKVTGSEFRLTTDGISLQESLLQ